MISMIEQYNGKMEKRTKKKVFTILLVIAFFAKKKLFIIYIPSSLLMKVEVRVGQGRFIQLK